MLGHHEQLGRLRATTPAAADIAAVIGDPCYDLLRASLPWRPRYRRALGATGDQAVIAISSTWREESLLGQDRELYARLLAELPADEFRVIAILHPHIWFQHGPDVVRRWLAPLRRSGLMVVPPEQGWRAALVAADHQIGDHGSVTAYGCAIGLPTSLAVFPESSVAPGSAVALLGELAPRLDLTQPLLPQLRKTAAGHTVANATAMHEAITSYPGEAAARLRALCYSQLKLGPPRFEPCLPPDTIAGLPAEQWPWRPSAMYVTGTIHSPVSINLARYPAELLGPEDIPPGSHLVVAADHPGLRLRSIADVQVLTDAADWGDAAETWLHETLSAHPGLHLAALALPGACVVQTRDGDRLRLTGPDDPTCYASAAFTWLATGRKLSELTGDLTVNGRPSVAY